ncbi:MAG: thymidine kinase, partial [Pirellulaceae bacterium]
MAKLYFYYSAMNAGKSTVLLQSSYNYRERGMHTLLLTPEIDTRFEAGTITSRIGLSAQAHVFDQAADLFNLVEVRHRAQAVHCILVDEAQFLSRKQVRQLSDV